MSMTTVNTKRYKEVMKKKENRMRTMMMMMTAASLVVGAEEQEKIPIMIQYPKQVRYLDPGDPKGVPNLELPREGKPRPPIMVPVGCDKLLSLNCKVTSSDPYPVRGELSFITDGNKEQCNKMYPDDTPRYWTAYPDEASVELASGTQWVQIDLGKEREIYGVCVWHFFGRFTVYHDVICQISNDPDFIDEVVTVFNNDHDNSSRQGVGKDKAYIETHEGCPIAVDGVKGRYVRFYSRGNIRNDKNHYIEIEVYGKGD